MAKQYKVKAGFVSSDTSPKNVQNGIELLEAGKFSPVVAKTFKLEEAATAQDFLSAGGVNGKVVLVVAALQ